MASEIGEGFAPFSISSRKGPDIIHQSPFQGNKNNKGVEEVFSHARGLVAAKGTASQDSLSSSILPPEAGIRVGFATNPLELKAKDSTPGTKSQGLLALAMKKIAKIFNL
ncbi:hypothetical protein Prudu_385S000700 [Prunus dulcis]|uniref:Uncharacterized protein n=1 Tax=Prunus dulcis TaxID=3755 RepID=A0A5H2XMD7_PRUDU|nr:hypothetical protein Prudu_385S000700 [Prunus dulcis]